MKMLRVGGTEGEEEREEGNKRASAATPLSKYFYDVAAFRGSLVKKGFPFVGRDTTAKCSPSPATIPYRRLRATSLGH